ncbi:MAG: DUF5011 domain-containing protein [Bacilli bacterium]|nr:DUF5011 domain-containing protein [Bacilli bacterium]
MTKEDKQIFIIKVIIGILSVITVSLIICQFTIEKNTTEFSLKGDEKVVLEVGVDEYVEEGFTAKSNGKLINDKVTIKNNVNTKKVGNYVVLYNLKINYLNVDKTLVRKVYVKDTKKPDLTINSDREINLYLGDEFEYPTYAALDDYDGDITNKVKVKSNIDLTKEGTYEINYIVNDSSNNEVTDKIVVNIQEKRKNPYISVSISNQTLYYYEYGELVLTSPVVTGINNGTPTGTFRVLNKARSVTLKGEDYESFVNYWIAFKGSSYGLHDASWRSSFGGNIYKYNGSHGCVNMPYYKVQQLYNMVEIGTPVYISY